MTTKYKIDFGNGTVLEATYNEAYNVYNFGSSYSIHHTMLDILGAKVTSIAPKEPFRFEADVAWQDSGAYVIAEGASVNGKSWSDLIGKHGKLIFIEGEGE